VYNPGFERFLPDDILDFLGQAIEGGFSVWFPKEGGGIVDVLRTGDFRS
jgi:hypothetical protein